MEKEMKIVLASGSPRRAKILSDHGFSFEIRCSDAPEVSYENEPARTVIENALAKYSAVSDLMTNEERESSVIIAADTIVWFNDKIYGKPKDLDEAKDFLHALSGQTHHVFTGVAVNGNVAVQTSAVTFNELTDATISEYVEKMNPLDRAGAYDIDTNGELLVKKFHGSYENIMGLPLESLQALLKKVSVPFNFLKKVSVPFDFTSPVGFFDSGFGGLCILEAFKKLCPNEDTVYLADGANCPYGTRTAGDVLQLSRENVRMLREVFNCKMIVVACNTATAAAIDALRSENPGFPFVGIEPAIKPAALESKSGIVGVLATQGTFNGRMYRETKAKFAKNVEVLGVVADEFVDIVESLGFSLLSGEMINLTSESSETQEIEDVVKKKIEPLLDAQCDKIVLGCTHFPHLKAFIKKVAGSKAEIIDPSNAVARHAREVLKNHGISASEGPASHIFLATRKKN